MVSDHIMSELESLGYIYIADTVAGASVRLAYLALKSTVLSEMMRDSCHYLVKGHSQSVVFISF